ncbi:MAG: hypothetical protein OSA97_06155 [Nevskia sp.]|nr:hypothetical protein [Nevskia sp.]
MDQGNIPSPQPKWHGLIEAWLADRMLSAHAEGCYRREAERFVAWWRVERTGQALPTRGDFEAFLEWLEQQPRKSGRPGQRLLPSSLAQARRIVGNLLRWMAAGKHVDATLALAVSGPSVVAGVEPIPDELLRRILRIVGASPSDEPLQIRAQLAAQLAFWAGASRSEMAQMRHKDIRQRGEVSVRLQDWFGYDRWIHVPETVYHLSRALAGRRRPAERQFVFTALGADDQVSAWSIAHGLQRLAGPELGVALTPRLLRDCFAQIALQAGWSEGAVALHLRRRRLRKVAVTAAGSFSDVHEYIRRIGGGAASLVR